MDPREMEALVRRLVQNPHDQDAITEAHQAGQADPRSYAMLLEKVGTATSDPAFASHWLTEAANVWSTTLGDAHRAARALMIAIDRDPTQPTPAERLADLYRDKGDTKALVALLERRAKALAPIARQSPELLLHLAAIHEELGRSWSEPPLAQTAKATEHYKRALECDPTSQYAIYGLREIYKANGQWTEAVPLFEAELNLEADPQRKLALYQDEADVRREAGDLGGATRALRDARALEGGQDPVLKQQLASAVLERRQGGENVPPDDVREAAQLFIELSEAYPGEHGFSYASCAAELEPSNDRAVQLTMYYGTELGREAEAAPRAAEYLKLNPQGPLAVEARELVSRIMETGVGDDTMVDALAAPPGAGEPERVQALLEMAQVLARKAKRNDAAARYREVLKLEPANEEAVQFLEGYLKQTRKYLELRDLLATAALDPRVDAERRKNWLSEAAGLSETQLRDVDGAIAAHRGTLSIDPADETAGQSLRRLFERAQRWDDLTQLLQQDAERTTDIEARLSIEKSVAKIHELKRKDPVATGEAWARIAALTPDDDTALATAVRHFEQAERPELAAQAIAECVAAVSDESARASLYHKLGQLREASGDLIGGGDAYSEGALLSKNDEAWAAAERCFAEARAWDQAATAVDERVQLATEDALKASLLATEARYLENAGDAASALMRLEQATELDAANDEYSARLEEHYKAAERGADIPLLLLKRAEKLEDKRARMALRKRAALLQKDSLDDMQAARESLTLLLSDGDDSEALSLLAADAEEQGQPEQAVDYLGRLAKLSEDKDDKASVMLRQAKLLAEGVGDADGAIACYEALLSEVDARHVQALTALSDLYEGSGNRRGAADALERLLTAQEQSAERVGVARRLADLYEDQLDDKAAAVRVLNVLREFDREDRSVLERLCRLSEQLENWERLAQYLAESIEVEPDEQEVSRKTRRLAEVLHEKVGKGDDALASLMVVADLGDEACQKEYVRLGDELGWKGIVATKLVEWNVEAAVGPKRNEALRGAFDRFLEVGREADAANVAKELVRTKGADNDLAEKLEGIAISLKDLDALAIAHDLLVQELSGPARAEEMVRQAEVMSNIGVDAVEAIQHGEQALTSVSPEEVEPLLERLSKLTQESSRVVDLYERQVTRCKSPQDRLRALGRAAQVAALSGSIERARGFFDIALGAGAQDDTLEILDDLAREADRDLGGVELRRTLAAALASGGQGSRDGGRTRATLLGRAAELSHRDLSDTDQAFKWLGDALVTHVDDARLDQLEELAREVQDQKRAESVLSRALEEVFDGPLVRKLLARRAAIRRDQLDDRPGAAADLKRLHDLSPSDTAVMDELSELYIALGDYRGMVQLYEDQILRGKDPSTRAELARKVARLWEEQLDDPREAADAWRRVLRMKSGDPEAVEGLERAKHNMLTRPKPEPKEPEQKESEPEEAQPKKGKPKKAKQEKAKQEKAPEEPAAPEAAQVPEAPADQPEAAREADQPPAVAGSEPTPDTTLERNSMDRVDALMSGATPEPGVAAAGDTTLGSAISEASGEMHEIAPADPAATPETPGELASEPEALAGGDGLVHEPEQSSEKGPGEDFGLDQGAGEKAPAAFGANGNANEGAGSDDVTVVAPSDVMARALAAVEEHQTDAGSGRTTLGRAERPQKPERRPLPPPRKGSLPPSAAKGGAPKPPPPPGSMRPKPPPPPGARPRRLETGSKSSSSSSKAGGTPREEGDDELTVDDSELMEDEQR